MALLIDGKRISAEIKDELKEEVVQLKEQGITGALAVIQVGNDPASSVYVRNKKRACEYIGIDSLSYELPEETSQDELLALIDKLNKEEHVKGILVQLPLPEGIDEDAVIRAISPKKDVDGFHPENVGALMIGQKGYISCTPAGIIQLLKRSDIDIEGKHCVIVGRSNIDASYVKDGAVVIDVGIHRDENNKLSGDVKFDEVEQLCSAITPVPGGVGPMTIAMLMNNCVEAMRHE